jgi:hypothetical protein
MCIFYTTFYTLGRTPERRNLKRVETVELTESEEQP